MGEKAIQIQKTKIDLTENQFKVIKDKYLKNSPTVEDWLYGVAANIALGEILYLDGIKEEEIFSGINIKKEMAEPIKGNVSRVYLMHHGLINYNERNENHKKFLNNLYRLATENTRCIDAVRTTAQKFYNIMANFEFLPNSPTLMNAGRELQQLSACYVLPIEDSIEGWLDAVKSAGIIQKSGGGTGFAASRVRPKGSQVKSTKGVASGPLSPLKMIDSMTYQIRQGGQRRGANMGILSVHHPDIMDFINVKKTLGQLENFNISVAIDEEFMNAVKSDEEYDIIDPHLNKVVGKKSARYVWSELVKGAWETGDPGIVIMDRINSTDSNPTPHLGPIESTNPCVTGDTLVTTEHGPIKIEDIVKKYPEGGIRIAADERVPVKIQNIDGTISILKKGRKSVEFHEISKAFFVGKKDVYKLTTEKGYSLKCTLDHKIFTNEGFVKLQNLNKNQHFIFIQDKDKAGEEKIDSIVFLGKEKVYDLTEPVTHSYICNSIVVSNCGEQPLLPNEPCFAPETLIATKDGLETIEELYNKQRKGETIIIATDSTVEGKEGIEFRPCLVSKTGHKKILEIKLNNGQEIKITPNHKVFTTSGWKIAAGLTNEDKVVLQNGSIYKSLQNETFTGLADEVSEELLLGWMCGDGWFTKGKRYSIGICFGPEETFAQKKLIPAFKKIFECSSDSHIDRNDVIQISTGKQFSVRKLKNIGLKLGKAPNKEVPRKILTAEKVEIIDYLGGLFSADGKVSLFRRNVRLTSASPKLIKQVQLLLLNFGIKSRINSNSADKRKWYELTISGKSYDLFRSYIGFPLAPEKQELLHIRSSHIKRKKEQSFSRVKSITDSGFSDVYDITEPVTHSLIANGMVVHNCNLGSINLSKFVKEDENDFNWNRLKQCVWDCTHFLDNVISVNNYPLPEIEEISKKNRRIGLGVMGWAESLVKLKLPYNSEKAFSKAEEVMKFINDNCLESSIDLGRTRGIFFNFRNSIYDRDGEFFRGQDAKPRNCARTTIAPTGTIGITAGLQGAGIEPFFAIAYTRYNAKGIDYLKEGKTPPEDCTFWEINPLFKKTAEGNNFFGLKEDELWKKIEMNHKSVKGIEEIPEQIQNLFLTSHDLEPEDHVLMQAAFQKHTNNAVSKTINLRNEATPEDVEKCYMLAYDTGCKGITIYRDGSKQFQVLNLSDKKTEKDETKVIYKPKRRTGKGEAELSTYYRVPTGYGDLHMHINYDEDGPLRVFANISPTGTEVSGLTCVIGILLSKYLEYGGDPVSVLKHLNSIKGDRPYGFGTKRIDSIPHAMAQALKDHLIKTGKMAVKVGPKEEHKQLKLDVDGVKAAVTLYCTKCYSSNVEMVSGCSEPTCFDCGYSKCS